jgi:hypothetical protein
MDGRNLESPGRSGRANSVGDPGICRRGPPLLPNRSRRPNVRQGSWHSPAVFLSCSPIDKFSVSEIASLFGFSEEHLLELIAKRRINSPQTHFTIPQLAARWQCSRATVYNTLRTFGAKLVNLAPPGKRGRKLVPAEAVERLERQRTTKMP